MKGRIKKAWSGNKNPDLLPSAETGRKGVVINSNKITANVNRLSGGRIEA